MRVGPPKSLPLPPGFADEDQYVDSLLHFATTSSLLQTLCGGVHVLDFFTRSPSLYAQVLPQEWRDWFDSRDIMDLLDLFMREDLDQFSVTKDGVADAPGRASTWRDGPLPPADLISYLKGVRRHLLNRDASFIEQPKSKNTVTKNNSAIPIQIAFGMNVKKVHEVDNFARYVNRLTSEIATKKGRPISHLVDFGSGQNYLGRTLASELYNKHIIAVESKQANIDGAKSLDVSAGLAQKPIVLRNKKLHRMERFGEKTRKGYRKGEIAPEVPEHIRAAYPSASTEKDRDDTPDVPSRTSTPDSGRAKLEVEADSKGSIQYVSHRIENGDLSAVIDQIQDPLPEGGGSTPAGDALNGKSAAAITNAIAEETGSKSNLMTISLHSCGNLLNHGLRTLTLNPNVSAVCMIGCCYNLLTERLGAPTYKLPALRPSREPHHRLVSTCTKDPHGFPMSDKFVNYPIPLPDGAEDAESAETVSMAKGIRLNITARMMGVQAPQNWGPHDSDRFFTRHFYRALLQRIFLDQGLIPPLTTEEDNDQGWTPCSPAGTGSGGYPIIIGSLKASAYNSFLAYVRAAAEKIARTPDPTFDDQVAFTPAGADPSKSRNEHIAATLQALPDSYIEDMLEKYLPQKHHLSIIWSLMAYSAGIVEAMIVVDRWLWLREQDVVEEAWVEPVFSYSESPRNLCIVAIKK